MTALWPSAILFSTWWSCPKRCACNWSQALTDTAFLLLSSTQLLLFDWSTMAPMLLITSIVMMSLWRPLPAQTPASERSWFLSLLDSTWSALWPRSLFLTCTLRLPSWESSLQKGGAELSHPVVLIWLLSLHSTGLWASCICSQIKPFPWHRQMAPVFYTIVIPLLNPMIYSLRNQEVKMPWGKPLKNVISCL